MKVPFSSEYFEKLEAEYVAGNKQIDKEKKIADRVLFLLSDLKVSEVEKILIHIVLPAVKKNSKFRPCKTPTNHAA